MLFREEFEHPSQASRVRLNIYDYQPEAQVAGMGPREPGFLVTEDRVGTTTVVSSLGYFPKQEDAYATVRARARELQAQRYRPLIPAA